VCRSTLSRASQRRGTPRAWCIQVPSHRAVRAHPPRFETRAAVGPTHPASPGRSCAPISIASAAVQSSSRAARLAARLSTVPSAPWALRPRSSAPVVFTFRLSLLFASRRRPEHGASRSLLPTVPSHALRCPASNCQPPHLTRLAADFASLAAEAPVRLRNPC